MDITLHDKVQIAASSVPIGVTSRIMTGIPLEKWVAIATLAWIAVQFGGWCYDRWKRGRNERQERQGD